MKGRRWWHGVAHAWAQMTGTKDVFIHHSVGAYAHNSDQAKKALQAIDSQHHNQGWLGIGYNFAVDLNGTGYIGRGWKHVGAHNDGENATSYGIVALGNFEAGPNKDTYSVKELDALVDGIIDIIKKGQALGRIRRRPRIRGHRDTDATACPGKYLYAHLPRIRKACNGRHPR